MAPEQLRGGLIDARTDVYALGLLAFELFTGRPPFAASDAAKLEAQHLGAPPPRVSEHAPVTAALDEPVRRCLAKSPAERPSDARAAVRAMAEALRAQASPPAAELVIEAVPADGADEPDDAVLDAMQGAIAAARALCVELDLAIVLTSGSTLVVAAQDAGARDRLAARLAGVATPGVTLTLLRARHAPRATSS
jgi:serine/threonine-protein kinase